MLGWLDIAALIEMKDFNGSFVAKSAPGLPFLLREGMQVHIVPPVLDMPRNLVISSISDMKDTSAKVRFADIVSGDDAERLLGCHCLVRAGDIGDIDALSAISLDQEALSGCGISDARDLIGWSLQSECGDILGDVVDVQDNPAHPFLIVSDDAQSEAMVPLVEDFIIEVDDVSRLLTVRLPKGLLEI